MRTRSPLLPDVPTVVELCWPQVVAENDFGVCGPAGLPKEVTERLARALGEVVADPLVIERFEELGLTPVKMNAQELTDFIAKQVRDWAPAIEAADSRP